MKAVRQIIDYLCKEGVLGKEDLAALAGGGFVGWHEVYREEEYPDRGSTVDDAAERSMPQWIPEGEDDTVRLTPKRPARAKRGRDVVRKGPLLDEKGLLARLREAIESWSPALSGLVLLARRMAPEEPCATWQQAAVVVRKAKSARLADAIEQALEQGQIPFDVLWAAVSCEPYREVIRERGTHGPAVSGYRAILASKDRAHLGRHVKLLRHREVASVYNLRLAQRKALAAMEPILGRRGHLFDRALTRAADPLRYWTFVLLYTAKRGSRGHRPPAGPGEHHPARDLPADDDWLRAWEGAAIVDPKAIAPFLFEFHEKTRNRPDVAVASNEALFCPRAWDRNEWER